MGCISNEKTVTDRSPVILSSTVWLPNQMSSVFDALSFSRREAHHVTRSLIYNINFCHTTASWPGDTSTELLVISKHMKIYRVLMKNLATSSVKEMNCIGPKSESCSIPQLTATELVAANVWVHRDKYNWSQSIARPSMVIWLWRIVRRQVLVESVKC